jgi:fructokinase
MYRIGIDLGGTKIEGIVLDKDLKEVYRKRIGTEQEKGYEHIQNNIVSLYKDLVKEIGEANHTFGIGTPGAVSTKTGLLKNSNTLCLNDKPFVTDLEKKLGRKVAIMNDANCFVMAEALMGAGKGKDMVFGVIMGTGCGGGIVYKGQVINGLQGIAGEWGHFSIDPNGPECYCGKKGCVEKFISGVGLEERYKEYTGTKRHLKDIMNDYRGGEEKATFVIEKFFKNFGTALSTVINILDPDIIVLGGGASNIEELYTKGVEAIKPNVFNDSLDTPIVKNICGDSAGVFGAALIGV